MPHRGTPGRAPHPCWGAGPTWGKGGIGIAGGTALPSLTGRVTYQVSLLTRVPRWSLGAFPALEGRKTGAEQQSAGSPACPAAPGGGGRALTGRPAAPMVPTIPL